MDYAKIWSMQGMLDTGETGKTIGKIRSARYGDIGPLQGEEIDLCGLLSRVLSGRNGGLLLSWW